MTPTQHSMVRSPHNSGLRITVGRGCARHHRCSPDRVGFGEVGGASIGSRCIGSHSGGTADPDIPILKEAKAEYAKLQ